MIRFEQVSKILSGRMILDHISFEIRRGETFVIVGPSGTGKSVTLKHMVKLMTPDTGAVYVKDECISSASGADLARLRRTFGYLFQGGALLGWMSVRDNVALPLIEHTELSPCEICEKADRALDVVGLLDDMHKMPAEISGGMAKRAGLARAIIMEPEIVLYDEPTSGLDPVTARSIDGQIRRMKRDLNMTNVVVTHDLHSALSIGDRIAMLSGGRIVELATPDEFVVSQQETVRAFLDAQYISSTGGWRREETET
jgi:phospholipid/cholesterol/gamma-HCH transport system ATP-binding protein